MMLRGLLTATLFLLRRHTIPAEPDNGAVSDKDEATAGWEGDDELDSEDLPGLEGTQQHTDFEAGEAPPKTQGSDQRAAGEPSASAAEHVEPEEPSDTGTAHATAASSATSGHSAAAGDEQKHGAPPEQPGEALQQPTRLGTDGVPGATERASSLDRQPDTPPLSPPCSPLPAASAEPAFPEAGSLEEASIELPEPGAAHQRRPSDDVESTASTSHARDVASALQEADAVSGPVRGTTLLSLCLSSACLYVLAHALPLCFRLPQVMSKMCLKG